MPASALLLGQGVVEPNRQNLLFGLVSWGFKLNGGNSGGGFCGCVQEARRAEADTGEALV